MAPFIPDEFKHNHLGFLLHVGQKVVQVAAGAFGAFPDADFGDVIADPEKLFRGCLILPFRGQPPADEGDEEPPGDRHARPHRQKVENRE